MALLDAADGKGFDGLVQVVYQREFLPRRHAPDEFDLELLDFGIGIREQGAHNFSIARPERDCLPLCGGFAGGGLRAKGHLLAAGDQGF